MVRPSFGLTPIRLLTLAVVSTALLAAAWLVAVEDVGRSDSPDAGTESGWQTIAHQGVRVDIPASWVRLDMSDCEFVYPVWTPPEVEGCDWQGGLAFYGSSNFDPVHGPGLKRAESQDEPEWGGYTLAGGIVVYTGSDDRDIAQRVLRSAFVGT